MKKLACFAIVVTILINVLGMGFLNVRAHAELATIGTVIVSLVGGAVLGGLSGLLGEELQENAWKFDAMTEETLYKINQNGIQNGEFIQVHPANGNNPAYFEAVEGLSGSDLEFANFLCGRLNSSSSLNTYITGYQQENNGYSADGLGVSASIYSEAKNIATNAFYDYVAAKQQTENFAEGLEQLADTGTLSSYNFDFVGPISGYTMPTQTGVADLTLDGFTLSAPFLLARNVSSVSPLPDTLGFESVSRDQTGRDYYGIGFSNGFAYGSGAYFIYNGDIYYCAYSAHTNDEHSVAVGGNYFSNNYFNYFKNKDGVTLYAAGARSVEGLYAGIYINTLPASMSPDIPTATYTMDDFNAETGGGVIPANTTISPQVQLIMQLIDTGVLPEDPTLTIGDDGTITAAEGIDLETLQSLLETLQEGQFHFEDIEGAMSTITTLLQAISKNTGDTTKILDNISDYLEENGVSALNESIDSLSDSLTSAITDALAIPEEASYDRENTELDGITGAHVGLAEASQFVSQWSIVNQCQTLISSILDENRYNNVAPNFKFYWDSDLDGVQEEYIALDLSFMENTLTNSNLQDKGRFTRPMTIREFLQQLIIFFCYTAFIIKVLRKLPGLVSGGESAGGDALELKAIERNEKQIAAINRGDPGM